MVAELDSNQRAAQQQFARQSSRYGKGHILSDVSDVRDLMDRLQEYHRSTPKVVVLPGKALDVATGGGHTGLYLAGQGWQVTLADLSGAMLERARAAAMERGLSVETSQHPAESFPHSDETFDLVTCRVAAHHFSDPAAFVRESVRVLRPAGYFILIDGSIQDDQPEAEEWLHRLEKLRDPTHGRLLSIGEWRRLCEGEGLQVIHAALSPFKQPDLNWYFETAATPSENQEKVRSMIQNASPAIRQFFRIGEEDVKIVWWWQRLGLLAVKR